MAGYFLLGSKFAGVYTLAATSMPVCVLHITHGVDLHFARFVFGDGVVVSQSERVVAVVCHGVIS